MTIVQEFATTFWLELERVLERVQHHVNAGPGGESQDDRAFPETRNGHARCLASFPSNAEQEPFAEVGSPTEQLRAMFGLSGFELDTLLLCAGVALDTRFQSACADLLSNPQARTGVAPTFGLAMRVLDEPHWSAMSGQRPLRYWNLLNVGAGPLLHAPLQIDERVLHFWLGVPAMDERLELVTHALDGEDQPEELKEAALRGVAHWRVAGKGRGPLLIIGASGSQRTALFCAVCREAGVRALSLDGADLPADAAERERLARAFMRESALWPAALLVRTARIESPLLLQAWLDRVDGPVAVDVEPCSPAERIGGTRLETPAMSHAERRALWIRHLGHVAAEMDSSLDTLVDVFALSRTEIRDVAEAVQEESSLGLAEAGLASTAWRLCRAAARRSLDDLAMRAVSLAAWDDLVLPSDQMEILRQIVANARQSSLVLRDWGFAARYSRGLGLSALFAGFSGTGKTMAAGILARELGRDLYQIDLASVTSKYIGETEKHLRRIFDAAERSGAILLFDEADALFGKRSQVRDSHDRYANMEISYLLQRMESYRGIAILTTNMQNTLDTAFQRRLRFVVQFPFPDPPSRERIWQGVFPSAAPTKGLDYARLAQLNVTGGVIRNVALLAAFLAADEGAPIAMRHVLAAARTEYAKLEKPLTGAETRGWE